MMGYRFGDFDKMTQHELWDLHDEHYRREIEDFGVFAHYCMSPQTRAVVAFPPSAKDPVGELRAVGPHEKQVWFSYCVPMDLGLRTDLLVLGAKLAARGKFVKG